MAEYEKNRKVYDRTIQRLKIETERKLAELVPQYVPESQQVRRVVQQQQQIFAPAATETIAQSTPAPVQRQREQGGLGIFKNIPYITTTSQAPYIKIYDSSIDGELRDILFINGNTTENLNFDVLLSRIDIDSIIGKNKEPNKVIDSAKDSVFLAKNMLLAQAGTAPSNPKQLSLSEIVGTTQILQSGIQKPFYIYVYKTNSNNTGRLDVTVMK
jgi:hypothetical protein